jgi:hypothetical protein
MEMDMFKAIVSPSAVVVLALATAACSWMMDDGSRLASQAADFAEKFRNSNDSTAVFEYTPIKGNDQRIFVGIGRMQYCPNPPCDGQGVVDVRVEKGPSGVGYRLPAAATVPEPLNIRKEHGPVRVRMRKTLDGRVEVVGLE